jgi:hypothetical protein
MIKAMKHAPKSSYLKNTAVECISIIAGLLYSVKNLVNFYAINRWTKGYSSNVQTNDAIHKTEINLTTFEFNTQYSPFGIKIYRLFWRTMNKMEIRVHSIPKLSSNEYSEIGYSKIFFCFIFSLNPVEL